MLIALSAVLLSLAAAGLVYFGWRQARVGWASATGWLLAFGSTLPWSWALGPEIGICYAIMVFMCMVWLEVAWNMEPARVGTDARQRHFQNLHRPSVREYGKHGVLFLLAVPGAGILALMLTAALALPLSWTMPVKVAVVIFLFPVFWGAFSVWICAQDTLLKPSLASVGALAFSWLLLVA
jgi:hypothetical protein